MCGKILKNHISYQHYIFPWRIIVTSQSVSQPPEEQLESWLPQNKSLPWVLADGIDYKLSLFITVSQAFLN